MGDNSRYNKSYDKLTIIGNNNLPSPTELGMPYKVEHEAGGTGGGVEK